MEISRADWSEYVRKLSAIDSKAASLMEEYIAAHGYDDPDALVRYAHALATKYGEASGALACEMYDEVAAAQGAHVPPAVPADTATYGETAKAIRGTWNVSPDSVPATTSRLVKQTGADTILKNAKRDGAQFAWVPSGDTCIFCMTLASRGWQYMSKNALKGGHAEHIHANCDCTYAVRFDEKSGVKGYDPQKYKEMYDNAEGSTSREKINSMRREQYAENKDRINAQKRMRYAERNVEKNIANQSRFDIMGVREESRRTPGSDKRAIVSDTVETQTYADRIKQLGESDKVSNIITYQARTTLWRRNGTPFEDLIFIDPRTEKYLVQRKMDMVGGVIPTDEMKKMVLNNPRGIIGIHNHPHNMLPSLNDLENAKKYNYGVILCHNGSIVKYTVDENARIGVVDSMLNPMQSRLDRGEDISLSLQLLEKFGVKMELFK